MVHPSAPSRVSFAPGAALKYREKGKTTAYESLAKEAGSRFVPFAFESFGGLGTTAISFLRDLASYAKESFLSCDYIISLSSLAVLLQKGNAEMLAQGIIMSNRRCPIGVLQLELDVVYICIYLSRKDTTGAPEGGGALQPAAGGWYQKTFSFLFLSFHSQVKINK